MLQLGIQLWWYPYVEWDPQAKQLFKCHVMMLEQQHPILLPTLTVQGC